jgi:hypothetical protein
MAIYEPCNRIASAEKTVFGVISPETKKVLHRSRVAIKHADWG